MCKIHCQYYFYQFITILLNFPFKYSIGEEKCTQLDEFLQTVHICVISSHIWKESTGAPRDLFAAPVLFSSCWLKKKEQRQSWELSVIWGKMKTTAWETTPQVALRNCSKEVGGEGQYIWDFGGGGNTCNQARIFPKASTSLMKLLLVARNSRCHDGY